MSEELTKRERRFLQRRLENKSIPDFGPYDSLLARGLIEERNHVTHPSIYEDGDWAVLVTDAGKAALSATVSS